MNTIGHVQRPMPRSTPAFDASGTSTIAPSARRANTMKIGGTSSSRATLMNRYEAPQSPARSAMSSQERRFMVR